MTTLFQETQETRMKPIGNNFSLVLLTRCLVAVYKAGIFQKEVNIYDQFDKRLFVVDLIEKNGVTKSRLAEVLSISRHTIDTWLAIYRDGGQISLVNSTKENVGRHKKDEVHREIVRPRGNKQVRVKKLREERNIAETEKQQQLVESHTTINFEPVKTDENKDTEHFSEEFVETNRFAGSFIYWSVFQSSNNIMSLLFTNFGTYATIFYAFLMMHVNKIASIEQLKTIARTEFGHIIGLKTLPHLAHLRSFLHKIVFLKTTMAVTNDYFKQQIQKGLVNLWHLFIDGHFVPYTGKEKIHKNFHTQAGEMEPGQNELFIHDIQGRIVYFDIQEGKGDMLSMIIEKGKEYAQYLGNISLLFVADKEIWGVDKFLSLSNCRFITWEKNTDSHEIKELPENIFSPPFKVNDIEYQVYETEKTYKNKQGKSINLRRLVIWNHQSDTRSVAVSSDSYEDSISLATAMLNCWGKSENGFKHLGDRTKMHYNPAIEIEKLSQNQEITNPQYYELQNQIQHLKKEIDKTERDLGRKKIETNKNGSLRKSKVRNDLQQQLEQLQVDIEQKKVDFKSCPEKINLLEQDDIKKYKVIDTEGKRIWNLTEVIFWNTRKKLIAMLKEYLPDERDLIPVLEAITKCKGIITSTKDSITVKLEPLDRPLFRQAQIQFCSKLNRIGAKFDNGKKIIFEVGIK